MVVADRCCAFGALVWLTYRLGAELFHPWVGVVAALVVLTRPALERDALLGYQDTAVRGADRRRRAARGAAAAARRARCSRCSRSPGCCGRRRGCSAASTSSGCGRGRHRASARGCSRWRLLAPVVWALHRPDRHRRPAALAARHGRPGRGGRPAPRDRRQVPYWTAQYFGYTLREPLVLGVAGRARRSPGCYRRRQALLPLAVVVAMLAVFAIGPVFGLPLIGRYVRTPAMLLALFYGLAVVRLAAAAAGPRRARRWMASASLRAALSVVFMPKHVRDAARPRQRFDARRPPVRRPARRRPGAGGRGRVRGLRAADGRRPPADPVPALLARRRPRAASATRARAREPAAAMLLLPRRAPATQALLPGRTSRACRPPAGYARIYRNRLVARARRAGCGCGSHVLDVVTASSSSPTSRNSV